MIVESGVIILMGFLALFLKLRRRTLLVLLGKPLAVDLAGSILAYALHWGTFSGVMAAAVAGLMLSTLTAVSRWCVGYIQRGTYYPGHLVNWSAHAVGSKP